MHHLKHPSAPSSSKQSPPTSLSPSFQHSPNPHKASISRLQQTDSSSLSLSLDSAIGNREQRAKIDFYSFVNVKIPEILCIINQYRQRKEHPLNHLSHVCHLLIDWLIDNDVKLIATDFDLTMITVHSGGHLNISQDTKNVLSSLSQEFNQFGSIANERGLKIICVTFSDARMIPPIKPKKGLGAEASRDSDGRNRVAGEALVRLVMERCSAKFELSGCYAFYPELYRLPEHYVPLGLNKPMHVSKSYHLHQACRKFGLKPHNILLIDDDARNCQQAIKEGYFALTLPARGGFTWMDIRVL